MAKYVYPAVFTPEDGLYSVNFPDLEGCYTCGDTLADAIKMAEDVLALTLYSLEKRHLPIPEASLPGSIPLENDSFVNLVACDTIDYQRRNNTRSVKKTLSIPEWLDVIATEHNANFSQDLQEILKAKYVEIG